MTIRPLRCDEIASLVHLCGEHAAYEKADYAPEGKSEPLRRAIAKEGVDYNNGATGTRGVSPMDLPRKTVQPVGRPGSDRGVRADGTLADVVARHPAEVLRGRAIKGKWTPNEIIGHLTDSEWVYGYRLRLILCEDEPAILGFRQDAWVASLRGRPDSAEDVQLVLRSDLRRNFISYLSELGTGLTETELAEI